MSGERILRPLFPHFGCCLRCGSADHEDAGRTYRLIRWRCPACGARRKLTPFGWESWTPGARSSLFLPWGSDR